MNNREAFDYLLGEYWNLAYTEGKTGESQGDKANEVLHKLREALASQAQQPIDEENLHCGYFLGKGRGLCDQCAKTNYEKCRFAKPKAQQESKPTLKVVNGEICYQSTDDDQSYGMWCPVSYDTKHNYKEGTKFIVIPPAPEGGDSHD